MTTTNNIPTRTKTYDVNGTTYLVWSNFINRCTMAYNPDTNDNPRVIRSGGYISSEKSVRKAIISVFGLKTRTVKTETKTKRVLTPEQKTKKAARAKARREAKKGDRA